MIPLQVEQRSVPLCHGGPERGQPFKQQQSCILHRREKDLWIQDLEVSLYHHVVSP